MTLPITLAQIAAWSNTCCSTQDEALEISGIVIDTRDIQTGNLFVAIKGERVDGHDFIAQARQAGAHAALVSVLQDDPLPQLLVDDVILAFAAIAKQWRQQMSAKVVAVTGSNGKTTVKEMIASILSQAGQVVATQGNLNNNLGVPLTLTRLSANTEYAVIEMGTNYPGEIAYLVDMVQPDISIITNVGQAHLEGLGSLDGVANEKGAIYRGLMAGGTAIINKDMPYVEQWMNESNGDSILTFSLANSADIQAYDVRLSADASHFMVILDEVVHAISLPLPGQHNVMNALAAIAAVRAINVAPEAIINGLASMVSVPHRLQLRRGINQSQLIDDSYNANPSSYQQALNVLASFSGEHWLVLGDFGELGHECETIHAQLGLDAKSRGVTQLITIGELSKYAADAFGQGARHFSTVNDAKTVLLNELNKNIVCLIKASHAMRLDCLADALAQGGEE